MLKEAQLVLHRGGNPYVRLYFESKPYDLELLKPSLRFPSGVVGPEWHEVRPQFVGDFLAIEIITRDDANLFLAAKEIEVRFNVVSGDSVERQPYLFVPMN